MNSSTSLLEEKLKSLEHEYKDTSSVMENQMKQSQSELFQLAEEIQGARSEVKKLSADNFKLSKEASSSKEQIEQLYYALQLMIRGLRTYRVKLRDISAQKTFLLKQ